MSKPATVRRPELWALTPPIARNVDDLPAPLPPSMPSTRPWLIWSVSRSTATTSPYRMDNSSSSTPVTAPTVRTGAPERREAGKTLMSSRLLRELPFGGDALVELLEVLVLGEVDVDLGAQERGQVHGVGEAYT